MLMGQYFIHLDAYFKTVIWLSPLPLNCPRGLCMTPYEHLQLFCTLLKIETCRWVFWKSNFQLNLHCWRLFGTLSLLWTLISLDGVKLGIWDINSLFWQTNRGLIGLNRLWCTYGGPWYGGSTGVELKLCKLWSIWVVTFLGDKCNFVQSLSIIM